jgi:hypothetical protein
MQTNDTCLDTDGLQAVGRSTIPVETIDCLIVWVIVKCKGLSSEESTVTRRILFCLEKREKVSFLGDLCVDGTVIINLNTFLALPSSGLSSLRIWSN